MAVAPDILRRMRQLIGTPAEWAASDIVIGLGELALERGLDGKVRGKVGDGVKKYSELDYWAGASDQDAAEAAADRAKLSADAAKVSETNAAGSATIATGAATTATNAAASALTASATVGSYPAAAASNVPRGLTQASVGAITPGAGGTNGTFALGWTGGNFTTNPSGTFTVAGGVVTAVTITGPGLYIGAAPTVPTPVFTASAGLAGANVALTAQFLVGSGAGYWVTSANGYVLNRYINNAGVPLADAGTASIVTSAGLANTVNGTVGGRENVHPDTFWTNYARWDQMGAGVKPYAFAPDWTIEPARAASPFPDGNQARLPGNPGSYIDHYLPNNQLREGDQFQYAWIWSRTVGASANGAVIAQCAFYDIQGNLIGGGLTLFTSVTGNLFDTTPRVFISPLLTVPAGAYRFRAASLTLGATEIIVDACWIHKTSVPLMPTDIALIPDGKARVAALEDQAPTLNKNNVLLKRVTYATRTLALAGANGTTTYSNNTGFSQSLLTSGAPAGGFNAVELPFAWLVTTPSTSPSRLYADVRTVVSSTGKHPVNGRVVARGWIDLDSTTGGGETYIILLRDPVSGAVKTITPADLDDRYTIAVYGTKADGTNCGNLYMSRADGAAPNLDPAFPFMYNCSANGGGGNSGSPAFGVNHLMLTAPVEAWKTPSTEFAGAVIGASDDLPDLMALPKKIWCVVGREALAFWDNVEQRASNRTNFMVQGIPSTSVRGDGIRHTPTGPGNVTVTITPHRGGVASPAKTVVFATVAASASARPIAANFFGDSLIRNGGMLTELNAIALSQAVTSLSFIGNMLSSLGSHPMVGADGTSLASYMGPTLSGGAVNPYYDPALSTYSFPYFLLNATVAGQLAALGKAEPDYVFIEAGQNETGSALTDGAAIGATTAWASVAEAIVQNILANTTATKVVVYTATPGPRAAEGALTQYPPGYSAGWRMRRNWTILAAQQIASFAGREAQRILVTATGAAIDPVMGWDNKEYKPRTLAMLRNMITFPTFAGMTLGYGAGTIAYATDAAAYFIKVGASGLGRWRDAMESDGFEWVEKDIIHYGSIGARHVAEANWAVIKAGDTALASDPPDLPDASLPADPPQVIWPAAAGAEPSDDPAEPEPAPSGKNGKAKTKG